MANQPAKILLLILAATACLSVAEGQAPRKSSSIQQSYEDTRLDKNRGFLEREIAGDDRSFLIELGRVARTDPLASRIDLALGPALRPDWEHKASGIKAIPFKADSFLVWSYHVEYLPKDWGEIAAVFRIAIATEDSPQSHSFTVRDGSRLDVMLFHAEVPERFDFERFELGTLGRAIGLRTRMMGCGAGGTLCSTEYLSLIVADPALRQVMRAPVASYMNSAGAWNPDGTRDRYVEELEAEVVVGKASGSMPPRISVRRQKPSGAWVRQIYVPGVTEASGGKLVYTTRNRPIVYITD